MNKRLVNSKGIPAHKKQAPLGTTPLGKGPAGPLWYTQDGKPDPNGLFDKDGFQTRMSARAAPKVDLAAKKREDEAAAKKAGYAK